MRHIHAGRCESSIVDPAVTWTIRFLAMAALVVASAKAHGREVRLLRESRGVHHVDFRADNGPVVEAIWRRDRWMFWVSFVVLGAVGAVVATRPPMGMPLLLVAVYAFSAAFVVAAIPAFAFRRRTPGKAGSLGWWLLVATLWWVTWFAWAVTETVYR